MGHETKTLFQLVGFSNFVCTNPRSDHFCVRRFHHIEFWCTDATNATLRFSWGLGMPILAKSDLSTGNQSHASYLLRSRDLSFLFTAPYSETLADPTGPDPPPSPPTALESAQSPSKSSMQTWPTRPAYLTTRYPLPNRFSLATAVLANNDETVLLPMNEPVYGTKRKSQIQTYLEHNKGAGVQHLALVSVDIFRTLREMRQRSGIGGFDFMSSTLPTYYKRANVLTDERPREAADDDGYDGDVVDGQRGTEMVAELATEIRAFAKRLIGVENMRMEIMRDTERAGKKGVWAEEV